MMTGNTFSIRLEHRKFIEDVSAYENYYTKTILDKLNANGKYEFDKYDYFYVTVKNTNRTQATVLRSFINAKQEENFRIGTAYGGIVWAISD